MRNETKLHRWLRRLKTLLILVFFYVLISVGYYLLPWSVRYHIYKTVPPVDRTLRKSGFKIMNGYDQLGWFGRDRRTVFDPAVRDTHAYGGYPSQGFKLLGRVTMLENVGYVAGYSDSRKAPLWVSYRVFDIPILRNERRPSGFKIDHRTDAKVAHRDYTSSGYDRGHMAPNYAIATRYGKYAQHETFLMSNVVPQKPGVNRFIWKDLEMLVAKRYGLYLNEIWVVTGPVYSEPVEELDSGVPIPSGYYKILIDQKGEEVRVMAFLVESDSPPFTRIKTCLVSVDELEERTGLDFFPRLPDEMQQQIEAKPAGRLWPWLWSYIQYTLK